MKKLTFYLLLSCTLFSTGAFAQVTVEKTGDQQFIYKFKVEGMPSTSSATKAPLETKPVIEAFLSFPNISECIFIEDASCFKVRTQGELDIAAVNETLGHFGFSPVINTSTGLPPDFPVYIDTGNPEKDKENYGKAKNQWIQSNPDKYLNLLNQAKTSNASK